MAKSIESYMGLPYTIELQHDDEEGWFARVKELLGCTSQGDTAEEALTMIQDAMLAWLEVALEDGLPIPEPLGEASVVRTMVQVPGSLQRQLTEAARRQGVSFDQYVTSVLAQATA